MTATHQKQSRMRSAKFRDKDEDLLVDWNRNQCQTKLNDITLSNISIKKKKTRRRT
jgi:hypothetical protein